VVGFAMTAALIFTGSATAATTVGNGCAADESLEPATVISLSGAPGNPFPNAIPSAGVITSWSLNNAGADYSSGFILQQKLKIFRPTGIPGQLTVVGESALGTVRHGMNTFSTRIPVQAGDLIASTGVFSFDGEVERPLKKLALFCGDTNPEKGTNPEEENPGDVVGVVAGDPSTGSTVKIVEKGFWMAVPITVKVEPDGHGHGHG
jgi:hypothetical protein